MKVSIDADRCRGHGICLGICPEVFELSDDGYAVAGPDVAPEFEDAVREAAQACPEQAIVVS